MRLFIVSAAFLLLITGCGETMGKKNARLIIGRWQQEGGEDFTTTFTFRANGTMEQLNEPTESSKGIGGLFAAGDPLKGTYSIDGNALYLDFYFGDNYEEDDHYLSAEFVLVKLTDDELVIDSQEPDGSLGEIYRYRRLKEP